MDETTKIDPVRSGDAPLTPVETRPPPARRRRRRAAGPGDQPASSAKAKSAPAKATQGDGPRSQGQDTGQCLPRAGHGPPRTGQGRRRLPRPTNRPRPKEPVVRGRPNLHPSRLYRQAGAVSPPQPRPPVKAEPPKRPRRPSAAGRPRHDGRSPDWTPRRSPAISAGWSRKRPRQASYLKPREKGQVTAGVGRAGRHGQDARPGRRILDGRPAAHGRGAVPAGHRLSRTCGRRR